MDVKPAHFVLSSGPPALRCPARGKTLGKPSIRTPCALQVGEFFDGLPAVEGHGPPSYVYQPNSFQRARYPDD